MTAWKASRDERNEQVVQHLHLVKQCATRLLGRLPHTITFNELFSAGVMGLMDAVEKFDPSLEIPFDKHAMIRIRGAMLDEIRAGDPVPRNIRVKVSQMEKAIAGLERRLGRMPEEEEIVRELGMSYDDYRQMLDDAKSVSLFSQSLDDLLDQGICPDHLVENGEAPIRYLHRKEIAAILAELIAKLPERERTILSLYYYEELTMREIGEVIGYTESRVSQLHTQILLKLRVRLRRRLSMDDVRGEG